MNKPDVLLISDPGYEGVSLLFNLASSFSSNIVWIAAEPPLVIDSIIKSYDYKGRLSIATPKQWKGYNFVNLMNLNEVSIAISKAGENMKGFTLIITIVPELLLVHGLEKTYLFMLNTIWKIQNQGGMTFAILTKNAQEKRDEVMMSRLFSMVFRLRKTLEGVRWNRELIVESPFCISSEVMPVEVSESDFSVKLPDQMYEAFEMMKIR